MAVRVTPPKAPVMVADVGEETPLVVTAKVRLVDPAGTVTLGGHGDGTGAVRQHDDRPA